MPASPLKFSRRAAIISAALLLGGCGKVDDIRRSASEKIEGADLQKEIEEVYERVKSTGAQVPDNAVAWAAEDIKKIGDWDYKVIDIEETLPVEIEKRLDEYGRERWEVFWVEEKTGRKRLYMKRPARSYLKHFPLREVLRTLPVDGGE